MLRLNRAILVPPTGPTWHTGIFPAVCHRSPNYSNLRQCRKSDQGLLNAIGCTVAFSDQVGWDAMGLLMIEAEIWIFGHFVAGVHTHFASRDWKTFNSCSRPGFTA